MRTLKVAMMLVVLLAPGCSTSKTGSGSTAGDGAASADGGRAQVRIGDQSLDFALQTCSKPGDGLTFQGRSQDGATILAGSVNAKGAGRVQVGGAATWSATALNAEGAAMEIAVEGDRLRGRAGFVDGAGAQPREGTFVVDCSGVPDPMTLLASGPSGATTGAAGDAAADAGGTGASGG